MAFITPEDIEAYAEAHTSPMDSLFDRLQVETRARTELPQMQVGRIEGTFLRLLARLIGARRVLEVGTFTGYSALCMAEGVPEDGEVVTLDVDALAVEIAKEHWAQSPHGGKIRAVLGDATKTIGDVEGPLDMVFIDADKTNYATYYEAVMPKLRTGGLVVADNTLWSGRVLEAATGKDVDADTAAIHAFNRMLLEDDRVEHVLLTVRDGMQLVRKR